MSVRVSTEVKIGMGFSGDGVTGGCETPEMGFGGALQTRCTAASESVTEAG